MPLSALVSYLVRTKTFFLVRTKTTRPIFAQFDGKEHGPWKELLDFGGSVGGVA